MSHLKERDTDKDSCEVYFSNNFMSRLKEKNGSKWNCICASVITISLMRERDSHIIIWNDYIFSVIFSKTRGLIVMVYNYSGKLVELKATSVIGQVSNLD